VLRKQVLPPAPSAPCSKRLGRARRRPSPDVGEPAAAEKGGDKSAVRWGQKKKSGGAERKAAQARRLRSPPRKKKSEHQRRGQPRGGRLCSSRPPCKNKSEREKGYARIVGAHRVRKRERYDCINHQPSWSRRGGHCRSPLSCNAHAGRQSV